MTIKKDWTPIDNSGISSEDTSGNTLTYWQDIRRRFISNKLSVLGVALIVLILFASLIGPMLTGKTYETQELQARNMPPIITVHIADDDTKFYLHPDLRLFAVGEDGKIGDSINPIGGDIKEKYFEYEYNDEIYRITFGTKVSLLNEQGEEITETTRQWNKDYLLGTDSLGRDMLTRVLYGGRISLLVAFIVTCCTLLVGVMYGGIAGYYGKNADVVMMRIVEVMMAIPNTIYVILLMVYFGQGLINILIAMAATSWLGMSRLVRGQVLSIKEQEYVLAARGSGVNSIKIITSHLLPNCIGPIIVTATLAIPGAIATEAFMSFIGLGVAPPMPSWGILSNEGIGAIRSSPYQILIPSIAISITMFAFNFVGDGLRDALDPRLRR